MKHNIQNLIKRGGLAVFSAAVLFALIASVTSQRADAAAGDIVQTPSIRSGTLSLTGTVNQQTTVTTIPANAPAFVITAVDLVALTSSTITAVPSYSLKNGSTSLTGSTAMTGTGAAQVTRITLAPPVVVASSTVAQPIVYNLILGGTASSLTGRIFIHGYNNQ